jgi:hypothetical protein
LSAVPSPTPTVDVDRILEAIRAEARARGSKAVVGGYSTGAPAGSAEPATVRLSTHGFVAQDPYHVCDYLAMPLDVLVPTAYRVILGREPDPHGAAYFQRALLRGQLTRIEVLGRLAFSPEGRARSAGVPGLPLAFTLATAYRLPVAGALLAFVAWVLRFPAHWRDRSNIEATANATGAWMKR